MLRQIRRRIGVRVEPFVPGVADDADDLAPFVGRAEADPLSDRILVRPVAARRRFVDDDDVVDDSVSWSVNARPRTSGMPIVWK